MSTNESLADITYSEGLQRLALRKQALDMGLIKRMPAKALNNTLPLLKIGSSFLTKIADSNSLSQRAKNILKLSPQQQSSEINKLQNQASSWSPEIGAGIGGGLSLGAPGLGISWLKNQGAYDPEVVARHLSNLPVTYHDIKLPKNINQTPQGYRDLINRMQNALKPKGLEGANPGALMDMYASRRPGLNLNSLLNLSKAEHLDALPRQSILEQMLGKAPKELEHMLPSVLGDTGAKSLLERANVKGFRSLGGQLRQPRTAAAGLLAALGVGGLASVARNYAKNVVERQKSKSTLNELTNYANSQQR